MAYKSQSSTEKKEKLRSGERGMTKYGKKKMAKVGKSRKK